MATTTNYGWTTPNDTDLVKDGAAAIRTLGSSVDTTTKNLNPETTLGDMSFRSATSNVNTRLPIGSSGQHLTVVAGVPAWATASDQTPLTTKGDLFTFSTVDARLGVGTNDHRLVAASGEATGLKYVADTQNTVIDTAGDLLYGTAADTLGRLAIGTAGQVLKVNSGATAPEWGAAGGASTLVLVKAPTSFSNVANTGTTFDDVFTSTYQTYLIVIEDIYAATLTNDLLFNFRYAGPTTQTAFYGNAIRNDYLATTYTNQVSSNTDFFLHTNIGQSGFPCRAALTVQGVGANAYGLIYGNVMSEDNSTGNMVMANAADKRTYTGFLLKSSSSNITGTVAVYAYARS